MLNDSNAYFINIIINRIIASAPPLNGFSKIGEKILEVVKILIVKKSTKKNLVKSLGSGTSELAVVFSLELINIVSLVSP